LTVGIRNSISVKPRPENAFKNFLFKGRGIVFVLLLTLLFSQYRLQAQIVINEIGISPTNGVGGEYIELYNRSGCAQSIGCFVIVFSGTSTTGGNPTGWTITIPAGTTLAPGGFFLIGGRGTNDPGSSTLVEQPGLMLMV
jgi:hypothetical protein